MVEIKRFYYNEELKEVRESPLIYYMSNHTEISLLHFLERELGDHLTLPDVLESTFAKHIITKGDQSRYHLNEFEGYLAIRTNSFL